MYYVCIVHVRHASSLQIFMRPGWSREAADVTCVTGHSIHGLGRDNHDYNTDHDTHASSPLQHIRWGSIGRVYQRV